MLLLHLLEARALLHGQLEPGHDRGVVQQRRCALDRAGGIRTHDPPVPDRVR